MAPRATVAAPIASSKPAWGDKWLGEGEPHFGLQSRANGQKLKVMLVDERGKPVKPQDIQYIVDKKVWPPE